VRWRRQECPKLAGISAWAHARAVCDEVLQRDPLGPSTAYRCGRAGLTTLQETAVSQLYFTSFCGQVQPLDMVQNLEGQGTCMACYMQPFLLYF
jgi:hypothetical protein